MKWNIYTGAAKKKGTVRKNVIKMEINVQFVYPWTWIIPPSLVRSGVRIEILRQNLETL